MFDVVATKVDAFVYTDEEFIQVLTEAETSGFIEHEEALKEFEKWGFVR